MSTTSQPTTFLDLFTDLMNRVRSDTGTTSRSDQAKRYINIALHDMYIQNGEKFPWAERRSVLVLQPSYATGTIALVEGKSAGVDHTGTGTLWDTPNAATSVNNVNAGGKMVFAGQTDVYTVSTVSADVTLTLAERYNGATNATSAYTYFEDEVALAADYARPIDIQKFSDGGEIVLIGRTRFRNLYPRNHITGNPKVGTLIELGPSGTVTARPRLKLHPPPGLTPVYRFPYAYVTSSVAVTAAGAHQTSLINDTDEPLMPLRYRHGIVLHALKNWYRDQNDDQREQRAAAEWVDFLARVVGDFEIGDNRPQIRPPAAMYRRRARSPWAGSGRRFDVGNRFDRLEDL